MNNAIEQGYKRVVRLTVGSEIYLYGNRKVLDVHTMKDPQKVLLRTNRGEFELDRHTLVSPKRSD